MDQIHWSGRETLLWWIVAFGSSELTVAHAESFLWAIAKAA